ncbi:MAG: IS200/IS605 family transposase [Nitrospira sp.]|nr:IS200/IS605 family transposase [Nitrospira sp.]
MKLHRQAHGVYKTQDHWVWVTRYRRNILVPAIAEYLKKVLRTVREFHLDWFLEEIGGERDHVHLPMGIPPKSAVSRVVGTLKRVISRQLKEQCPHGLSKVYWDGGGGWARGCFASTVGINEATIRHYVQHQGEQETGHAQLELSGDPARKGGVLHRASLEIPLNLPVAMGTPRPLTGQGPGRGPGVALEAADAGLQ